jgi:prolyl-tRNA synthetase
MKLSNYFYKGQKNVKEDLPLSLNRLIRGCFIIQEASGIFRLLPLGLRVLKKLIKLIEEEMDKIAIQIELPFIQSTELWKKSGRYEVYGKEMLRLKDRNNNEFILPPTCEEAVFDTLESLCKSYKDLPKSLYQITWKFRDELRPRGGLLRGRLFLMKDSYSFAIDEKGAYEDYVKHFNAYVNIFKKLELEVYSIKADSGEIGGDLSNEFVVKTQEGDSEAYLLKKDIINVETIEDIKNISGSFNETGLHKSLDYQVATVMELGHIFYYDQKYSKSLNSTYTSKDNKQLFSYGGCYGIGVTRLMGVLSMMEFWPEIVSPFEIHMTTINNKQNEGDKIYEFFLNNNIDVLYDNRNISFGEKKYDLSLIGIPKRIIVGEKIEYFYKNNDVKYFEDIESLMEFLNKV